jgi:hypothetical protein
MQASTLAAFDRLADTPADLTDEDLAALTAIGLGAEAHDAQQRAQLAAVLDTIATLADGETITAVCLIRIERR